MVERSQAEISQRSLDTIFEWFLNMPTRSSWAEKATLSTHGLGLDVPLGRAMANHLAKVLDQVRPILRDQTNKGTIEALRALAEFLVLYSHSEKQAPGRTLDGAWNTFISHLRHGPIRDELLALDQLHDMEAQLSAVRLSLAEIVADYQREGIYGLEEVLVSKENLPVIDKDIPDNWVNETRPLLPTLESRVDLKSLEITGECAMTIEYLRTREEDKAKMYKLRIPVILIPVPSFARVDQSAWVDLGIASLEELYNLGPDHYEKLGKILATIKKLETDHNLIIRGDGVIHKKE